MNTGSQISLQDSLLGPETSILWIVNDGSRQRDDREEAGLLVTEESRLYSSFSLSVNGRTLSSMVKLVRKTPEIWSITYRN